MQDALLVFITEYTKFIGNSWSNLLLNITYLIILRQIYELLAAMFPFIRSIANTLFAPFRFLHVWFHLQAVKNLNANRRKLGRDQLRDQINLGLSFRTGLSTGREGSSVNIFSAMNNDLEIRESMYIANAPTLPGFAFLIAIVLAGPVMQASIMPWIHLYFILGITLVLLPSGSDTMFILNTILVKTKVSAWYIIFIPMIFFISAGIYSLKFSMLGYYPEWWWLEPIIMGTWSTWVYILLLGGIIFFTNVDTLVQNINPFTAESQRKKGYWEDRDKREYDSIERRRTMMHFLGNEEENFSE